MTHPHGDFVQRARGWLRAVPLPCVLAKEAASIHLLLEGAAAGHGFILDKTCHLS